MADRLNCAAVSHDRLQMMVIKAKNNIVAVLIVQNGSKKVKKYLNLESFHFFFMVVD